MADCTDRWNLLTLEVARLAHIAESTIATRRGPCRLVISDEQAHSCVNA